MKLGECRYVRTDPAVVGVHVDVAAAEDRGHAAAGEAFTVFQDGRDTEAPTFRRTDRRTGC
jgi:hypothetical protein